MTTNSSPKPNPMLIDLEGLVGDWEMELSNAAFIPHPNDTVKGQVSFEWIKSQKTTNQSTPNLSEKSPIPPNGCWDKG